MAFEDYEISQEGGSRVELFTLAVGTDVYRMHDSDQDIINYGGDDYYRTSYIGRGHIATGQEHLKITLPGGHQFSTKFTTIAPGQQATLTIQAYHRSEPSDVRVIYKGVVRAVAFTDDMAKSSLSVVPISEAFDKEIPERTYQASCNNILFDANCKVSEGSYSYTDSVSAENGGTITVSGLESTKGNGWATGGYVSYGTYDYRMILEQDGDDLVLNLPFYSSVLGKDVTVYAGCSRSIAVCDSKFSNSDNFGGCPYVPTKNIFSTGV
jgi:uncharacterized phage protein (TIGR02218 family)